MIPAVGTSHYAFAQTQGMYYTESEPSCRLWISGDNEVSVLVADCSKWTALVQDVDGGGGGCGKDIGATWKWV